jgi:hypothetical protein
MARARETAAIIHEQLYLQDMGLDADVSIVDSNDDGSKHIYKSSSSSSPPPPPPPSLVSTPSILSNLEVLPPNPSLNEGRPCHVTPGGAPGRPAMNPSTVHRDGPRIECAYVLTCRVIYCKGVQQAENSLTSTNNSRSTSRLYLSLPPSLPPSLCRLPPRTTPFPAAFRSIFFRAPPPKTPKPPPAALAGYKQPPPPEDEEPSAAASSCDAEHEFDVVVCHGNVIRYATMRALQLPPEAWLRTATFNCSLTYLVVRPSGSVSLRTFGDVGHLPMNMVSFSGHHGFAW